MPFGDKMNIRAMQEALRLQGFDPGPIDGILGRRTSAAIRAFQSDRGLVVDGIVGPITRAALEMESATSNPPVPLTMPWLLEAYRLIGTKEQPGAGSNEAILGWAERLRISYATDEVPWCGLFVSHCISSLLPQEPLPSRPLVARGWSSFGVSCSAPQLGSVLVFWRESRSSWKGHTGFYWAEDDFAYHVLGGNQSQAVNITRYPKKQLLASRWPVTAPTSETLTRRADERGRLTMT